MIGASRFVEMKKIAMFIVLNMLKNIFRILIKRCGNEKDRHVYRKILNMLKNIFRILIKRWKLRA